MIIGDKCTRDVEAVDFKSLLLQTLTLPLPLLDDVVFASNVMILKFFGKDFFQLKRNKAALL